MFCFVSYNDYHLTELDFRFYVIISIFKMIVMTSSYVEKCYHLVSDTQRLPNAYAAALASF